MDVAGHFNNVITVYDEFSGVFFVGGDSTSDVQVPPTSDKPPTRKRKREKHDDIIDE